MRSRLAICIHAMLIGLDQLGGCVIRGFQYLLAGGEPPNPDETISSWVGRHAVEGKRWALLSEQILDGMLGDGHCRTSIGS